MCLCVRLFGEKHAAVEVDRRDSRHNFIWKLIIDSQAACAEINQSAEIQSKFDSLKLTLHRKSYSPGPQLWKDSISNSADDLPGWNYISNGGKMCRDFEPWHFWRHLWGNMGKAQNDPQKNSGMAMDGLLEPQVKGPGNDFFACPLRMSNDSFSTFPNLPRCTKKDDSSGEEVSC